MLGFQDQFVPYVEDGSKTHTIRNRAAKVGETLHCFARPRQKGMRLLGRWPCVRVEPITLEVSSNPVVPILITISGVVLTPDETNEFAWRDGFRPVRRCDAWISIGHYYRKLRTRMVEGYVNHWRKTT